MRSNINFSKHCVFCKYWMGSKAVRAVQKNMYDFDNTEKALCAKRQLKMTAYSKCNYYSINYAKYPEAQ